MPKKEPNFAKLLKDYRVLDLQEREIKLKKDQLKETVRGWMEETGREAYEIKEGSLSYSKYIRKGYDSAKLEKMFSAKDLEPAKKETEVISVRITPSKDLVV